MDKTELSKIRLRNALECLDDAETLLQKGSLKSAANRAYYAVFHAMRAVLALDDIDMRHHSGVIAEFRRLYIKTGVFPTELSAIISGLFNIRSESDYDDLYLATEETVTLHVQNAKQFVSAVNTYLNH